MSFEFFRREVYARSAGEKKQNKQTECWPKLLTICICICVSKPESVCAKVCVCVGQLQNLLLLLARAKIMGDFIMALQFAVPPREDLSLVRRVPWSTANLGHCFFGPKPTRERSCNAFRSFIHSFMPLPAIISYTSVHTSQRVGWHFGQNQ